MAFDIIRITRNEESIHSYVELYKSFRLLSLKTSPECFGSTYAREVAFTDDIWYNRLANPNAITFLGLQSSHIVSTVTVIGPLPCSPEETSASRDLWIPLSEESKEAAPFHCGINGMFTLPEARGQGIARALLEHALNFGSKEAAAVEKVFAASIIVDEKNPAARALYTNCGFVLIKEEVLSPGRKVLLLKYQA